MSLGEHIYRLRTQRGMSQEALAEALNVSRQSVSKWENSSAVPELEKLVGMSRIFEVSLDVLVNGTNPAAEPATSPEAASERGAKPAPEPFLPHLTGAQLLGGILLLGAILFVIISWAVKDSDDWMICLLLASPIGLCGTACISMKHPLVVCGWLGYVEYLLLFFVLTHRWESSGFGIFLAVALALGMLALTVRQHKRGITVLPWWLWALGFFLLSGLLILLLLNTLPTSNGYVTPVKPVPMGLFFSGKIHNFPISLL